MTRTSRRSFRPEMEALETRDLMAGGISASFSQGILKITGTEYGDSIRLRESGSRVTLDGFTGYVSSGSIKKITIDARGGNDTVLLALSTRLTPKVTAYGGSGTDSILFNYASSPYGSGWERVLNLGAMSWERATVDSWFPGMKGEFEVQAGSTPNYNCIAWSLGVTWDWINPKKTLAEFDKLNGQWGYKRLNSMDFSLWSGYEKIVLYGKKDASGRIVEFTHQARQLSDGTWTSKLGSGPQIRHLTPQALSGSSYGVPVAVYYRVRR